MKFSRFVFLVAVAHFLNISDLLATTSGYGCKINNDYVYTQYLGKASAYQGQPAIIYYNSNGPKIPIYWGYGCNDCRGYRCGYINVYGATSYWDPQTNSHVPVPAENEMIYQNVQCVIAPALGAAPVATDSYVYYTYNKTDKCAKPPTNVPLDDHIWIMLLGIGFMGFYFFKKQVLLT